jgi:UDP-2,3-diacylglucosamine pyrophosphatase LpxH
MEQDNALTIIVVSDFHMTVGADPLTGAADRHESFVHDAAFARFLANARDRAAGAGRSCRLLILGDLFDFLRVADDQGAFLERPANSERAALAKLERIAAGHPLAFQALGAFAAAGGAIDIVAGNHDVELTRPAVQTRLRALIAADDDAARLIRVHPWIVYLPGVLYAEHGQQYHGLNSFATLLPPNAGSFRDRIDPPLGSFLETYRLNLQQTVERITAGGARPRALWRHPEVAPRLAGAQLRFAGVVVRDLVRRSSRRQAARRAAYRRQALPVRAAEIGLRPETLGAIDRLAEAAARGMAGRIVLSLSTAPRLRRRMAAALDPTPYMARAAQAIHRVLDADDADVPFYVFGHTHCPDQRSLIAGDELPHYLNAGSWAVASHAAPPDGGAFPFVEIRRDSPVTPPVASLRVWNDAEGRCAPFPTGAP